MTACMRLNTATLTVTRAARFGRVTSDIFSRRALVTSGRLYATASSSSTPHSSVSKNGRANDPAAKDSASTLNKEKPNGVEKDRSFEPWSGAGPPIRPLYKAPPRASSMSSPEMRAMLLSLLAFIEIMFCLNLAHMLWSAKRQSRVLILTPLIVEPPVSDPALLSADKTKPQIKSASGKEETEKTFVAAPNENVPISDQLNDLIYPVILITTSVVTALLLLWIPSRTATRVDFHIPSQTVRIHHPGIKRLYPSPVEFKLGDLYTKELLAQHPATSSSTSGAGPGVGGLTPLAMGSKPVLLYARGQRFPRTLDPTGEFNVKKFNEIFYGADNNGK